MIIADTIDSVRKEIYSAKAAGKVVGVVPTMGALHDGHYSLVSQCRKECDYVVVTIFVNPTQFGPNEDLDKYPKTFEQDCAGCKSCGADLIFAPTPEVMYPDKTLTWVTVEGLTENLCGSSRPTHFRGVTTVVAKLFNIVLPDIAYFGQKDAQQVSIIEKMTEQLNFPTQIKRCPIIRESDGLAMSSRNKYLNKEERQQAICLKKAIDTAEQQFNNGCMDCKVIIDEMRQVISDYSMAKIDYISIVDNELITYVDKIEAPVLVALAVYIGNTRLIDNIVLS